MALLDPLLGGLTGVSSSPFRGVLMIVLGPSRDLAELLSSFEQAGLGHLAQSWIGNGPNQPVSPKQLQTVFGEDQVQTMARQSGMAPHYFLSQLSQHLPRLVDSITPNGRVPDERYRSECTEFGRAAHEVQNNFALT
jgi:uncharacterized protein YidB (DUF937 family)